jgi:serine/threonine protein phosphatase 1
MARRFAISDIHGCAKTFQQLLEDQLKVQPEDEIYLLGDYIDRGPDSKGVIDLIQTYKEHHYQFHCLAGNHEDMLLQALKDADSHSLWEHVNGGDTTLDSFGVRSADEIPESYLNFIRNLDYYITLPDYLLVHAGFNFDAPDPFSDYRAMLWIRGFKTDLEATGGRKIVHGHTPRPFEAIENDLENRLNTLNIDNGCAYPKYGMMGLVALDLDNWKLIRQPYTEDQGTLKA